MRVFLPVVFEVQGQLVVASVVGQPLHHRDIKHVGQAGVPYGEYLLADGKVFSGCLSFA